MEADNKTKPQIMEQPQTNYTEKLMEPIQEDTNPPMPSEDELLYEQAVVDYLEDNNLPVPQQPTLM